MIVTKEDHLYEESRMAWNRAIQMYPLQIIYCKNKEEVSRALLWAKEHGYPIRIRSGRHHYEGYSTGNDVVVIDVSQMNGIQVDEENELVTVEGGVRNRALYEEVCQLGYPFPGGGCPTVGVAGLVLGGGWGYSARMLGLSCDSLIEVEMIDVDGNCIKANAMTHPELFWALKGAGGGNFGIVVSMTFKLPKKNPTATLIQLEYKHMNTEARLELVKAWQTLFETLPHHTNMKMALYNSKEKGIGIAITGVCYGSQQEAFETIKPLIMPAKEMLLKLNECSVLEINRIIQDSHPDYEKYKSTGRFVYRTYNEEQIQSLLEIVDSKPEASDYTAITFYGLGGQIQATSKRKSAVFYRDARFILGFQSVWEDDRAKAENCTWLLEHFPIIEALTEGSFINFPLAELTDYKKAYYGDYKEPLENIKAQYDPENRLHFPQGL